MEKIDIKKTHKLLYIAPHNQFVTITVPPLAYVKLDGTGDPNSSPAYAQALQWLYSVSYAVKFMSKAQLNRDYVVPPLEGLWWADDPTHFVTRAKNNWHWTMMIMTPDFISSSMIDQAVAKTMAKSGTPPQSLRHETLQEATALQALHIGPYDDEGPLLATLHHEVMPRLGLTFNGPHHEIYLSDPRKTEASKLKTILRQPVRPIK